MAYLIEDSDDEFPDLATLIRKHGADRGLRTKMGSRITTRVGNAAQNENIVEPNTSLQNMDTNVSANGLSQFRNKPGNYKLRRRVLNKSCDNALLLPFDPLKERKLSVPPL